MAIYGFIGSGNMGSALAEAAAKTVGGNNIMVSNRTAEKAELLADRIGCEVSTNPDIACYADYIILGVKPQMMAEVLGEIAPILKDRTKPFTLVSMAAGLRIEKIRTLAGGNYPVIRIMPNTPCAIGKGLMLWTADSVSDENTKEFLEAFKCAGSLVKLQEHLFDAGSAVSGCGPAYVFMFIEAMADGAVECGIPRSAAYELACNTLIGASELMLLSGKHPGELKDAVCSPGGSTIEAVRVLENKGFRNAVMEAIIAARDKNQKLG